MPPPFPRVVLLTSAPRADSSCLLQFQGAANKSVTWTLTHGGGAVLPLTGMTDPYGRAYCRYDAGGYTGKVSVTVSYGVST